MLIRLSSSDKLRLLRQLDRAREWRSIDDRRFCLSCCRAFSGRQVEVIGGTRQTGRLRLLCPTDNCCSIPSDWVLPNEQIVQRLQSQASEANQAAARVVRVRRVKRSKSASGQPVGLGWKLARLFGLIRADA